MKIKHLILALCVFTACSKSSDNSPSPVAVKDASTLISLQDAASITGETYSQTDTSTQSTGFKICKYSWTTVVNYYPVRSATGSLTVSLYQSSAVKSASQQSPKDYFQTLKSSLAKEAVTGVGDDAFISTADGTLHVLYTDNYYFEIDLTLAYASSVTDAAKKTMKINAATKVVEKLKSLNTPTSNNSSKVFEATQLVSMTEAATITGEAYTKKKTSEQAVVGLKLCGYSVDDDGLFQIGFTQTAAINGATLKVAKEFYQSTKDITSSKEMVTGVGDEAFYSNDTKTLSVVYTDNYYITIYIAQTGLPTDPNRWSPDKRKTLAIAGGKKAIENLKKLLAK